MLEQDTHAPQPGGRDWLAALLMRRQSRLMPRLAIAFARLRAAPRHARRRLQRRAALSLGGAALLLALSGSPLLIPTAQAATITVANGQIDFNAANGQCSLIEAVNNANNDNDTSGGDCVAGAAGADTINLPAGGAFTFSASYVYDAGNNGLPTITSEITINGNGSTLDLGGAAVGVRLARVSASGDLTVVDTTISGGYMYDATHGGGVFRVEGGELTIDDSTLTENATRSYGGAIFALDDATLTITNNSTISGNLAFRGGGVYSRESATTIEDSAVSGNTADRSGGGVQANRGALSITGSVINDNGWEPGQIGVAGYVDYGGGVLASRATLSIATTTIDGNYSGYGGGGLWVQNATGVTISQSAITNNVANGAGGGVRWGAFGDSGAYPAIGSITNTTISGNVANDGGGVVVRVGELTLNNVTVSDNTAEYGGGILVDDTLTLNRTIISGNSADSGDEVYIYSGTYGSGTVTANNFNLFGHNGVSNAAAFTNFAPGATDITATSDGTEPTALAAILAPLADNGGPTTPATETHALVANSPALDRGPNAACAAAPVDGVDQRDVARNQNGIGAASANECDVGAYEYAAAPVDGICPAPGNEVTTILGIGMGNTKKASLSKKLVVPNSTDLVALYGQLAGKHVGKTPRFVRFTYPGGGGTVQVNTPTGTAERLGGVTWYGTALEPASSITGRWFLAPKTKGKVPRALILYATYETTATTFDTYVLYTDGATNTVAAEEPWAQSQTLTIPIDAPLAAADITVQVALVDNDKDSRAITVIASAGAVQDSDVSTNPTHGDTLNIITLTLEDVPAGTEEVTLELLSGPNGDSATIVGAAANYACEAN